MSSSSTSCSSCSSSRMIMIDDIPIFDHPPAQRGETSAPLPPQNRKHNKRDQTHKTESTTHRIKHIKHNISKHRESNTQNTTQHNTKKLNTPLSVLVSATTTALPPPSVPVLKIERCTFAAEIQSARQSVILLRESSRCLFHTLWLAGTSFTHCHV